MVMLSTQGFSTVDRTISYAITKLPTPLSGLPLKLTNWTLSFFSCVLNPFCPLLFLQKANLIDLFPQAHPKLWQTNNPQGIQPPHGDTRGT